MKRKRRGPASSPQADRQGRAKQTAESQNTPTAPRAKRYAQCGLSVSGPKDDTKRCMIQCISKRNVSRPRPARAKRYAHRHFGVRRPPAATQRHTQRRQNNQATTKGATQHIENSNISLEVSPSLKTMKIWFLHAAKNDNDVGNGAPTGGLL